MFCLRTSKRVSLWELIYLGFDQFLSMEYKYFTIYIYIYISMFSTLLGMFSGSGAFQSKAMTLEHFGA